MKTLFSLRALMACAVLWFVSAAAFASGWNSCGEAPCLSAPTPCSTAGSACAMPLWQSMQVLPSLRPFWCALADRRPCSA